MIVPTAGYFAFGIAFGEHPNVTAVVARTILLQEINLDLPRLQLSQGAADRRGYQPVALKCPTRSFVARAEAQR